MSDLAMRRKLKWLESRRREAEQREREKQNMLKQPPPKQPPPKQPPQSSASKPIVSSWIQNRKNGSYDLDRKPAAIDKTNGFRHTREAAPMTIRTTATTTRARRDDNENDIHRITTTASGHPAIGSVIGAAYATKASPSSSVSLSQSPALNKQKRPRKSSIQFNDDSSSDSELEDLAGAMLRRAGKLPPLHKEAPPPKKKLMHGRSIQMLDRTARDLDEEEDPIEKILQDSKKKKSTNESAKDRTTPDDLDEDEKAEPTVEKQTNDSSPVAAAAAARSPVYDSPPKSTPVKYTVPVDEEKLWADSEDEEEEDDGAEKPLKAKRIDRKRKSSNGNSDPSARIQAFRADEEMTHVDASQLKPDFAQPRFGPFDFEPLRLSEKHAVPASISRYLPNYQHEGIKFMYNRTSDPDNMGVILGDDMGLGKTVQVISLIAALLGKTGTGADALELQKRKKRARELIAEHRRLQQQALDRGEPWTNKTLNIASELNPPEWAPILIVVPPSIIPNWTGDFATWGHFGVTLYRGDGKEKALEDTLNGVAEVLVCPRSLFEHRSDFRSLCAIQWKAIIADEFHSYKNPDSIATNHLRILRDQCMCVVIGLTGTVMQNNHKELWTLVDLVCKGYLGPWSEFRSEFSNPIKLGRASNSTAEARSLAKEKSQQFSEKFFRLYIKRTKEDVLRDALPDKDERIVFCELSELQKRIYRHVIEQPDFVLLSKANGPCDCGINTKFFLEYQNLETNRERIEYQRLHKGEIITRGQCCYKIPTLPDSDVIDPGALLWRQMHASGMECEFCPYCITFPALHILFKLSSHVSLLQLDRSPDQYAEGSKAHDEALKKLQRAKFFFPEDAVEGLPGKSYIRETSIMDNHFALSGKMRILDSLLNMINRKNGRVLLFSASTQMLDLIQNYIRSKGYTFLRVDGSTTSREHIINDFKKNRDKFIFLLSTKAMGLGVNLTEANYVVIFDVEWNPSYDAQAQDRAYRIGQEQNVTVYRLVARGTIEELKYLRQVYKTQLQEETIIDVKEESRDEAARLFRGVADDKTRRGELFGLSNLLKYTDGNFMTYKRDSSTDAAQKYANISTHTKEDLVNAVNDAEEEESPDELGPEAQIFDNIATKRITEHDEDDCEDVLGGDSQAVMDICENVQLPPEPEEDEILEGPNAPPVHVPLSARSWNYRSSAEREISAVAVPVAVADPSWPPPGGDTEVPMAYAVPVAEAISSYHPFPGRNATGSNWQPVPESHTSFPSTKLAPVPERETVDLLEDSSASDEQSSMQLATQNPPKITENTLHSADTPEHALDTERNMETDGARPSREETFVPEDMASRPNGENASAGGKQHAVEQDSVASPHDKNDSANRTAAESGDSPSSQPGSNSSDDRRTAAAVKPPTMLRGSSTSPPENDGRKPERRNVAVCGMSVKTMKGSRATATTFSLGDLAVPGSLKKKKKKPKKG